MGVPITHIQIINYIQYSLNNSPTLNLIPQLLNAPWTECINRIRWVTGSAKVSEVTLNLEVPADSIIFYQRVRVNCVLREVVIVLHDKGSV